MTDRPIERRRSRSAAAALALVLVSGNAMADPELDALKAQVDALEEQVKQLREVIREREHAEAQSDAVAVAAKPAPATTADAEWKKATSVVHLAGYGAVGYTDQETGDGRFSQVLFAPIFHYQYEDLMMLESELEFEVAENGETETNLEYLALDLFLNDYVTLVGGKFLSPLGQFRQNQHPSWINKLPSAPAGFGHDGAAPSSEVGLQLRGGFPLGATRRGNYAVYVGNGPQVDVEGAAADEADGSDHADATALAFRTASSSDEEHAADAVADLAGGFEVHGIESEGTASDEDGNKVIGGRVGFLPMRGFEVGVSGAAGKVGLYSGGEPVAGEPDRDYSVLGMDFALQRGNLDARGEYVEQKVGSASASMVPEELKYSAWYTQLAYKFLPTKWEGVLRYSDLDAPGQEDDQTQWALGANYLFANNVMAKLAYESNDGAAGSAADEDRWLAQLAYGF